MKRLWAVMAVRRLKAARAQRLAKAAAQDVRHPDETLFLPTEYERRLEKPRLLLAEGVSRRARCVAYPAGGSSG